MAVLVDRVEPCASPPPINIKPTQPPRIFALCIVHEPSSSMVRGLPAAVPLLSDSRRTSSKFVLVISNDDAKARATHSFVMGFIAFN